MAGPTSVERGRQARARLLASARELVGEIGWNAVSTRNLAEHAGLRAGLVHYHFESLQALLRQAAIDGMRAMLDASTEGLDDTGDPADAVETILTDLDRHDADGTTSLLFVESYLAATRDPQLRAQMAELMLRFRRELTTALDGAGHPDAHGAAVVVLATFDGFMLHKGLDPELSAATIAPTLRRVTRAGVGHDDAPRGATTTEPREKNS